MCVTLNTLCKWRDDLPPNSVHITIMHPLGRKHWPGLEEKGFLSPSAMSLFPAALSCNSKGRKGGNSMKTKRWKDWYRLPSNLHWWAGGDSIILSENEKMSRGSWGTTGRPQIWTEYCILLNKLYDISRRLHWHTQILLKYKLFLKNTKQGALGCSKWCSTYTTVTYKHTNCTGCFFLAFNDKKQKSKSVMNRLNCVFVCLYINCNYLHTLERLI